LVWPKLTPPTPSGIRPIRAYHHPVVGQEWTGDGNHGPQAHICKSGKEKPSLAWAFGKTFCHQDRMLMMMEPAQKKNRSKRLRDRC
jgi:hypothetical protein